MTMKRLFSIIFLLSVLVFSINAQKTYVLLAGVSNYGDEEINLYNTTKDVKQLKKVFDNQQATTAIVTSKYASHANIVKKLDAISRLAKADDQIVFFFSGHGTPGGFVTSDRTLFNYQELVDIVSKSKAARVLCLIDACMSGSVKSISANNFGRGNSQPQITFMTSSDGTETSAESSLVGHGFFTKALLKGLRGMCDKDTDKQITLIELFNYVYSDVTARTKGSEKEQHPQLIGPGSMYNMVLAKW